MFFGVEEADVISQETSFTAAQPFWLKVCSAAPHARHEAKSFDCYDADMGPCCRRTRAGAASWG